MIQCKLLVILLVGFFSQVFAHVNVVLIEKESGQPLQNYNAFLIDPVDSAVLGYDRGDANGEYDFSLSRRLKSQYFQVKVFGLNIQDTLFLFDQGDTGIHKAAISHRVPEKLGTVYYNEQGIADYSCGVNLDDFWICAKKYNETYEYYMRGAQATIMAEHERAVQNYLEELRHIDSLSKANPGVNFMLPVAPEETVMEWVIYEFVTVQMEPAGGWDYFLRKLFRLKSLQANWQKRQVLRMDLSFSEKPYKIDSLVIFNSQNQYEKKSEKIWKEFEQVNDHAWNPLEINRHKNEFIKGFYYYIEFVYREED